MELDEFDVPQPSSSPEGGRDAIASGNRGVGGYGVDLADTASCQHHRTRVYRTDPAPGALSEDVQRRPGHSWLLARLDLGRNEIEDQRMLHDLDPLIRGDCGYQSAFDLRARGVTPGVRNAIAHMAALASELQLTGKVTIELRASIDQLGHFIRTFDD